MFYDRFIFKVFREVKKNKKKINAHLKMVYSFNPLMPFVAKLQQTTLSPKLT